MMNFRLKADKNKEKIIKQIIDSHIEKRLDDSDLREEELRIFVDYIKENSKNHINSVLKLQQLSTLIIVPSLKNYTRVILNDSRSNYSRVLQGVKITQKNTIRENVKVLLEQKKYADEYYDNIYSCIKKIVFVESDSCEEVFKLDNKSKKVMQLSKKYMVTKNK